jgi:hypothetical protein
VQSRLKRRSDLATWVPFHYREFYDLPRIILFEHQGHTYLLDCQFSEKLDEYPDVYDVLEMNLDLTAARAVHDWGGLRGRAVRELGKVAVKDVRFDATLRRELDVGTVSPLVVGH